MKRNFYLQHQLMAMHDPRMQNLFDKEGPRGIGTYWIIIEKLSLLPDAKAQLKYLRSSTSKKLSITYIEKIIRNFQLFVLEEDGSFSPEELNPVKKKEKKTAKSDRANAVADAKNDENRQKTAEEKTENSNEKQANALNTSTDKETSREVFKENIKDITTSAIKEKETAAADDVNFNPIRPWQEVVDGLAVRTPWLEAACIHSGYGELLMRHIETAVDLLQEAYRSLRQMAQPAERKRCTPLFREFHKSRTAHFASPVRNPHGTRRQATVRRSTRPLPLRTAHRRSTHLPGLSHPRQCPAPTGQHRFLE